MSRPNPYDEVPYRSDPLPQTHPDRMATIARLFSLAAPQVETCRVLELGCASGGNLIPMAHDLPRAQFVGVDLSQVQIQQGQASIDTLGLENIDLRHASILDVDSSWGTFDFVICHGVYSWVPPPVQEKILDIAATMLTPNGVAYISYNTYPGWHMRGVVRDMMRYHALRFGEPQQKVEQARMILDFVAEHAVGQHAESFSAYLKSEAELLRKCADYYIYHEHLEDNSRPVYFHEFVSRIRDKGLDFLGESRLGSMVPANFNADAQKALNILAHDAVELEQFMDFLRNRTFRETLVHRAGPRPEYTLQPQVVFDMFASSVAQHDGQAVDLRPGQSMTFKSASNWQITTPQPLLKAALLSLAETWPAATGFDELLKLARQRLAAVGAGSSDVERDRKVLGKAILTVYTSSDVIELSVSPSRFTTQPGERPVASPLARQQVANSQFITTRRHDAVRPGRTDRAVLALLDGSLTCEQIAGKLGSDLNDVRQAVLRIARSALLIA